MARRASRAALIALALVATRRSASPAVTPSVPPPQVRVTLDPSVVKLGERARYRVDIIGGVSVWSQVEWLPPDTSAALSWAAPRTEFHKGRPRQRARFGDQARTARVEEGTPDTARYETSVQAFALGVVPVSGVRFRYRPMDGGAPTLAESRAPTARLVVMPVLSTSDSNATLLPVHGPLAAPWWERVPWRWVAAGLLLLAAILWAIRALRRRPRTAPAAPAEAPLAPAAVALAELAALRALDLPGHGRFAEHAFRLGQILRRYLEALWPAARPGDTTPELVRHLGEAGLSSQDLQRLAGLLRVWDRVKFAREPFTADEAVRAEVAVESFVRRPQGDSPAEAA